jgi:hypothetical protein
VPRRILADRGNCRREKIPQKPAEQTSMENLRASDNEKARAKGPQAGNELHMQLPKSQRY